MPNRHFYFELLFLLFCSFFFLHCASIVSAAWCFLSSHSHPCLFSKRGPNCSTVVLALVLFVFFFCAPCVHHYFICALHYFQCCHCCCCHTTTIFRVYFFFHSLLSLVFVIFVMPIVGWLSFFLVPLMHMLLMLYTFFGSVSRTKEKIRPAIWVEWNFMCLPKSYGLSIYRSPAAVYHTELCTHSYTYARSLSIFVPLNNKIVSIHFYYKNVFSSFYRCNIVFAFVLVLIIFIHSTRRFS